MTQKEVIKEMLSDGSWLCGTVFMQKFIPEFRSRINEIRKEGFIIEARLCQQHNHRGNLQEWRLLGETMDKTLPAVKSLESGKTGQIQGKLIRVQGYYE